MQRITLTTLCTLLSASLATAAETSPLPFPMDHESPGTPLVDNSHFLDGPAGKGGFIRVEGEHLVGPDGSRFRIWGVNMTGPACFPEREDAVRLADDLARMGVNCVRFHGLDSAWGRSAIDYSRDDTQRLDEENLDRFDYFVHELKQRGIYSNLNINVFRKYKPGDGVRDPKPLGLGKSATYFNPRLLQLQRDYARQLLTHKNRHTGNEYRYEPAVACVEMLNENSVLEGWLNWRLVGKDVEKPSTWSPIPVSYAEELTDLYNAWLPNSVEPDILADIRREAGVGAGQPVPRLRPNEFKEASRERFFAEARFYMSLEHDFFARMRKLLVDELGVKPLLVGTSDHNDSRCLYTHVRANMLMDFLDGHGYWQHPRLGKEVWIKNTPMVNDPWDSTVTQFARTPVVGRPFTISETNHPFPHIFASEGIPILTAYALFHDWDGIYWYTYLDGPRADVAQGIRGCFDMSRDPMKMTEVAACASMWYRRDVQPAEKRIVRHYTLDQTIERLRMDSSERPFFTPGFPRSTPLRHATRWTYADQPVRDAFPEDVSRDAIESDTGELKWLNAGKGRGIVRLKTERTCMLVGHVKASGLASGHLAAEVENDFCTLVLSSLDGRPIAESRRLALMTAARATNREFAFKEDGQTVANWGRGPALIEPVVGRVTIRGLTDRAKSLRIIPLSPTGKPLGATVAPQRDGSSWLIPIGEPATIWMLIEVER